MNGSEIDWFPIKLSFAVASAATLIALIAGGRDNEAFTLAVIVSLIAIIMLYLINRFGSKSSRQ